MSIFNYLLNRNLAHVRRFNNRPLLFSESVAEHSFYVAHFAQILILLLKKRGTKVDSEKTLSMALVHDSEEGFSGDILNPFKHFNEKIARAIAEVNEETVGMMFEELPAEVSKKFIELWHEEQKRDSIESQIVKVADSLSLISKCFEEIEAGNSFFQEIYKREITRLKSLDQDWWNTIKSEIITGADKEV